VISVGPKTAGPALSDKPAGPQAPQSPACAASLCSPARLFGATEIEGGFPHSEIFGSKPVRGSPKLIAAYHVLHRLSAPRHPPDTLKTLDCSHRQSACFSRSPTRRRRPTRSGAKRPVLLQTHPGILAVKLEPATGARRIGFRGDKTRAGETSRPRSMRLAPSGPRPNALPLHDVRYRKALAEAAKRLLTTLPDGSRPAACAARSVPSKERTDESHRKDQDPRPGRKRQPPLRREDWWSQTGSNRRPHACKARALPTELWPRQRTDDGRRTVAFICRPSSVIRRPNLVGLGGLEPPTSRLSSARSNQLSYKPGRKIPSRPEERTVFPILIL
jgi:hypothetical protein